MESARGPRLLMQRQGGREPDWPELCCSRPRHTQSHQQSQLVPMLPHLAERMATSEQKPTDQQQPQTLISA